jgi:hypothetical protein
MDDVIHIMMVYRRPAPRVRGVPDALCVFSPHTPSSPIKERVKRFVPIRDVQGYMDALRHEGFYTEEEMAAIEKKHRDALPPPKEYPGPVWVHRVSSTDQVYVKLVVGQTKVKVIAFHPYAPLFKWWAENPGKPAPIDVRAEYHLLLGMPKEMVMKMVKNHEKKTVKALKPVVKSEPVFD